MNYADLHCHILPGLDDGARTMKATLSHARRLEAAGVHDVACTPHVKRGDFPHVDLHELVERRADAQAAIDAAGVEVRLHPGGELADEDGFELAPDELELIAQGPASAPFLLLECPFPGIDDAFEASAERLAGLGYGLLLAHPERAYDGHERLDSLLDAGALLQVNVSSLLGHHGERARDLAESFVRGGEAFCLASDGHPGSRDELLDRGIGLARRLGLEPRAARALVAEHPGGLLARGVPAMALAG
jgi:protein-tyrosine phosphatase